MLIDPLGRHIWYLRFSVTDRCDLRCFYCMGEDVRFTPKADILNLEEIERLCAAFIALGVRKLRLTGGEPLVRRGIDGLIARLGIRIGAGGLQELTLTTNGNLLADHARALAAAGMRRVNVSLDTLSPDLFARITRGGDLAKVLTGIAAAHEAGLAVKINTVALRGLNEECIDRLIGWCGQQGLAMALLETMPLGDVGFHRADHYLPLDNLRRDLEKRWTLLSDRHRSGGPARYVTVAETGGRLGFITPLSHDFCGDCNRVRVTAQGRLYPCLGSEAHVDLRALVRANPSDTALGDAIAQAIAVKPARHDFVIDPAQGQPALRRAMHVTGG